VTDRPYNCLLTTCNLYYLHPASTYTSLTLVWSVLGWHTKSIILKVTDTLSSTDLSAVAQRGGSFPPCVHRGEVSKDIVQLRRQCSRMRCRCPCLGRWSAMSVVFAGDPTPSSPSLQVFLPFPFPCPSHTLVHLLRRACPFAFCIGVIS
jgi:hypothetical protein